ncbi:stromelysin-2-like [Arctopsyche grandis]|uniref:stromelysin-2-like n=1 Tax=Arctopsyche grandis TaxID=121162 RepID=UPI00406D9D93
MSPLNILIYLFVLFGGAVSTLTTDEIRAVEYLRKYGYIDKENDIGSSCNFDKEVLEKALKSFQDAAGLKATGIVDEESINRMNEYRCGMGDLGSLDAIEKDIGPLIWGSKNLTFAITEYPSYLRSGVVDSIIMQAFAFMSKNVDIIFSRVLYEPDIEIKFVSSISQSAYTAFDEGSHVTAVSSVPGILGKIYFNDEIEWSRKNVKGFSLFRHAVHQIAHILGLGHGNFTTILSPFVGIQEKFNELEKSDLAFNLLQTFYGPQDASSAVKKNSLCGSRYIDTIYRTRNYQYLYVFVDKYYWKMDSNRKTIETAKLISEKWSELVGPIDAAYQDKNGWTYVFIGSKFWKYFGSYLQDGYPKNIVDVFPNGPAEVSTAIEDVVKNELLLTNKEYTYVYIKNNNVRNGYQFKGNYRHGIIFDTALYSRNTSTIYVFQNDKYDLMNMKKLVDSNYYGATNYRYELPEFFKCTDKSLDNLEDDMIL